MTAKEPLLDDGATDAARALRCRSGTWRRRTTETGINGNLKVK